jgi:hypothetical protein
MNSKYIMAIIKMPIELFEDGSIKQHDDKSDIDFKEMDELPPVQIDMQSIKNKLDSYIQYNTREVALPPQEVALPPQEVALPPQEVKLPPQEVKLPPQEVKLPPQEVKLPSALYISKEEIRGGTKQNKSKHNSTFKSKKKRSHNYSVRQNSTNEEVADSLPM